MNNHPAIEWARDVIYPGLRADDKVVLMTMAACAEGTTLCTTGPDEIAFCSAVTLSQMLASCRFLTLQHIISPVVDQARVVGWRLNLSWTAADFDPSVSVLRPEYDPESSPTDPTVGGAA